MSRGHILKGQLRVPFVPTDLHATDESTGMVWGPLFGFDLCVILRWREVKQGRSARG